MKTIDFSAGCHIKEAAQQMMAELLSEKNHKDGNIGDFSVEGAFNGITLVARKGSTVGSIVADFNRKMAAASEAYRNSPEGKRAARESEKRKEAAQQKHDALMQQLPNLDFADDVAVLDWLCEFQDHSDHIGVVKQQNVVLATFAAHGYYPNANTGTNFNKNDRDNYARYIIGQALGGLACEVGAIHHMVIHFTEKWKQQFVSVGA